MSERWLELSPNALCFAAGVAARIDLLIVRATGCIAEQWDAASVALLIIARAILYAARPASAWAGGVVTAPRGPKRRRKLLEASLELAGCARVWCRQVAGGAAVEVQEGRSFQVEAGLGSGVHFVCVHIRLSNVGIGILINARFRCRHLQLYRAAFSFGDCLSALPVSGGDGLAFKTATDLLREGSSPLG